MNLKTRIKHLLHPDYPILDAEDLSKIHEKVSLINTYSQSIENKTDEQLKELIQTAKNKLTSTSLDDILVEIYGIAKVVCQRKLGMTPYDVQLFGAIAMHERRLIEMQTGEGKTLTAVLPIILNALTGKGVHVLTFNDYLAKRDATWMRPVYEFFGLTAGFIQQEMLKPEKRKAYHCDITYATAKSVGFDYLRDFMTYNTEDLVLRPFNFAIVDEADALLIDEGRNPLVLAGDMISADLDYYEIARLVETLEEDVHYKVHPQGFHAFLIVGGVDLIRQKWSVEIHKEEGFDLHAAVNLALTARLFLKRDVNYIVKDKEILLVDDFTGRVVADRKWRNGLQTAVEAKEGLPIQAEGTILNTVTLQHFIRKYPKLAGMTATAQSAAEEFQDFYSLKTVVIPPNKPCIRIDHEDKVFRTKDEKYDAIVKEIQQVNRAGQPILVGTLTVRESEYISQLLTEVNIKHQVLNAKNDEEEAKIISKAGELGAVTISTNMAGRGTDIKLGGEEKINYQRILELGGLYVLGTNRHESLRIDRQLRGRSGRQGDVGLSRFFISFEDDLMVKYKLSELLPKRLGQHIQDNKKVQKAFDQTQGSIENCLYDVRKNRCEYSDFVEKQRLLLQSERQDILYSEDVLNTIGQYFNLYGLSNLQSETFEKLKVLVLFQYDKYWANYLSLITQVRENIHAVRLGGQNPIRIFREHGDELFQEICDELENAIQEKVNLLIQQPDLSLEALGVQPPTSTWTFVSSDNPFENQLAIMLLDNGNIGFQVDPFAAFLLFGKAMSDKMKRKK